MFKNKLKDLLKARDITAYRLAKLSSVSESLISRYLNGLCSPGTKNLFKISDALGIDINYFKSSDIKELFCKDCFKNYMDASPFLKSIVEQEKK